MTPWQHTVHRTITCEGVGLHSGQAITMTIEPALPNSGIRFQRTDIDHAPITANWENVQPSMLCTTLCDEGGIEVKTIEHIMAALAAAEIDNALITLTGEEVPIMDGSAAPFLDLIKKAGKRELRQLRRYVRVLKTVEVHDQDRVVTLTPADTFTLSMEIDFASKAIGHQRKTFTFSGEAFSNDIANARTFGFKQEVDMLRSRGLVQGGSLDNAVVVDGDEILNPEGLRHDDECVRHKVLDAVGDLYMAGNPLLGHFHGVKSGHYMNYRILEALFNDPDAWEEVTLLDDVRGTVVHTGDAVFA